MLHYLCKRLLLLRECAYCADDIYMDGRYPCHFTTMWICFLRMFIVASIVSFSIYCASSPDSRGDPRLPSRCYVLEGGFLDRLRCC